MKDAAGDGQARRSVGGGSNQVADVRRVADRAYATQLSRAHSGQPVLADRVLADACLKMEARDAAEGVLREAIEVSTALEAKVFLPMIQLRLACMLDTPDRWAQRMDLLRAVHSAARAQGANAVATEARRLLKLARGLTGRAEERSPR